MSLHDLASTPKPPYYAAIFTSQRSEGDGGYGATAERMLELARAQPGFLGVESVREAAGLGITVSYWSSREDIRAWKDVLEHRAAQARGRAQWYTGYQLRICKVEAEHGFRSH
ncbi:MAG: antibiotic biosynthesis monooxygenase [Planctomycetes bacterium]|jgi:heme-degrading monooxygenase HmoA|nr:antibiotic biosynthesis monooxygenase [Planctomycetota bacterium]